MTWRRSRMTVMLLALLVGCSFLTNPVISSGQSSDDAVLHGLAERFFAAYQNKDLDALVKMWSEKSPDFRSWKAGFQRTIATNRLELKSLTVSSVILENRKAAVRAVANLIVVDAETGTPVDGFGIIKRTLSFVKESDGWKVWRYDLSEKDLAERLVSAKTEEERAAMLAADGELVTFELVEALVSEGRGSHRTGNQQLGLIAYDLAMDV